MSVAMVEAIRAAFAAVEADPTLRIVLLRGAGGHFCAGGDVADMAEAAGADPGPAAPRLLGDPIAAMNRRFGAMLGEVERSRAAVVAVCEGAVMGGAVAPPPPQEKPAQDSFSGGEGGPHAPERARSRRFLRGRLRGKRDV